MDLYNDNNYFFNSNFLFNFDDFNVFPSLQSSNASSVPDIISQYVFSMGVKPTDDTVKLLEEIIIEQIDIILSKVTDIAKLRNSTTIGMEDFIFFFRKDKVRLKRMYDFLSFSQSFKQTSNSIESYETDDPNNEDNTKSSKTDKSIKKFKSFLSSIDVNNGVICDQIFGKKSESLDIEKKQQLMRLSQQYSHVSEEQYVDMINLRRKAFKNLSKCKFECLRNMVWDDSKHLPIQQDSYDIVGFLFRELLTQLIEISLLVRKEQTQLKHYLQVTQKETQTNTRKRKYDNLEQQQQQFDGDIYETLQTTDIIEACRRCTLTNKSSFINHCLFGKQQQTFSNKNMKLVLF